MKRIEVNKDLDYYLSLPYTTLLRKDEEGDVVARIDELPGCVAHGKDNVEALSELESMKRLWIEDCLERGQEVPEPHVEETLPSGKWVQRVPRSLHAKLTRAARKEGVSLNQLVTSILSEHFAGREFQRTVEQMMAECISAGSRTHAKSYWWPSGFVAGGAEHYWDAGAYFESKTAQPVHVLYADYYRRTVESLLNPRLRVKIENVPKKYLEGAFACQR